MKRLMVLLVAIAFLSTFPLTGCKKSEPPKAPEQGVQGQQGAPAPAR